ncbi:MAG: hypothetical protein IT251_05230 [Chitinophagaceae bacterium]|nr:hypothetical protein [Chitinophagaceae bacterium]
MKLFVRYSVLIFSLFFVACSSKETINLPTVAELNPLQNGKVFIYRLDSTVVTNFSKSLAIKSYHAKDSIADNFVDVSGKQSFKIYRYITDTLQTNPWIYNATFFVSFNKNNIEFTDNNNLRTITIASPIKEGTQWYGSKYINAPNTSADYYFLKDWFFEIKNADLPFTVKKGTINNTYTILQADEADPGGPLNPSLPRSYRAYSVEVYAKGIGLIYKEFLHWEWQNPNNDGAYTNNSYGIKLNLIDYK